MPGIRQDLRRAVQALAFRQSGYFTAAQALQIGYSYQAQKHHADTGNWTRVDRGIFRLPDWPGAVDDAFVRWSLWSHGRGVVSHESALSHHGLSDVDPTHIHLTVSTGFHARDPAVSLHYAEVPEADQEVHSGWSVTTPLRTLVDVAGGDLSPEHVDRAVSDALAAGLVTRRRLLRRTAEEPERPSLRLERALAKVHDV